jgi:SH3 domain-containing YSC84-like protein 1
MRFTRRAMSFLFGALIIAVPMAAQRKEEDRVRESATVMEEILKVPDSIPHDLLDKAECVVVVPSVKKLAFVVGASYGRGTMICRTGADFKGPWGAPSMTALEGGSFGFQLGGEATDFVFLIMNNRGANSLLSSKVKLGADAAAAAGPKGRAADASTDAFMRAEILSYSRDRGLFAGVSLEGSTLRPDNGANKEIYGRDISAREIVLGNEVHFTPAGAKLAQVLQNASPKNLSS